MSSKKAPAKPPQSVASKPVAPAPKPVGRSLEEFKTCYDKSFIVPAKIKAALAKLDGSWQYEVDFAKLAAISLTDLAAYRAQFEDHVVATNRDGSKRVWAGTRALATRLKEMVR